MSRSSSLFVAIAAAATGVLGLVSSPARAISLADIIADNGYIISGDKKFYDFEFFSTCNSVAECTPVEADDVDVHPIAHPNPYFGIEFNSLFSAPRNRVGDIKLGYTVEVLDPNLLISDIHMFTDIVPGLGTILITETALDMNGNIVAQLVVDSDPTTPEGTTGWVDLETPVKKLMIQKDIGLLGLDPITNVPERAFFSIMQQSFSQTDPIPEPGTVVGLLAIGSFGVSEILKRHKKAK